MVRRYATHRIVCCWGYGDLLREIISRLLTLGVDSGESFQDRLRVQMTKRQSNVRHLILLHLLIDRAGDDIARCQLRQLVDRHHKSLAVLTQQVCTLATHSLADERCLGRILQVECRRVELYKLHIDNTTTRLVGDGQSVTDGSLGVCRAGVNRRSSARGEEDMAGVEQHLASRE